LDLVASKDKHKGTRKGRPGRAAGYKSARKPKLRGITLIEPRPVPAADDLDSRFGAAAEDGLRMLAALETMQSLEPDFGEDLAAEASVTIIERAVASDVAADQEQDEPPPAGSLRARLGNAGVAPDIIADEYAAYQGPVEEAVVEIVELPGPAPDRSGRRRRRKDRPATRRFFKTLTGDG
jgi:hypothetical protein